MKKEYFSISSQILTENQTREKWDEIKKPKEHIKKHGFQRDTVQEKVQRVVELSCRAASGITQGLPQKCPGNTQYQSPCDSTHKSQNQNSPQSLAYPMAKAKSQHRNQHLFTDVSRSWIGALVWKCMMQ